MTHLDAIAAGGMCPCDTFESNGAIATHSVRKGQGLVTVALVTTAVFRVMPAHADDCPTGHWCERSGPSTEARPRGEIRFDAPPPPPPHLRRKHAVSLRLSQMVLSDPSELENSYLTGVGLSLRVRPMRWIGIEPGVDFFSGYDRYDAVRQETTFSTDLLFYLNPRDAVQVFGLTGASLAVARHSEYFAQSNSTHLGVQLGAGLEFRVTHLLSFNVNAVGFSRKLTGAQRRDQEQYEAGELVERSSGGFMARGSAALYF